MLGPTSPISRPRPPSQTRRSTTISAPNTPAPRLRTQSHTPSRVRPALHSQTTAEVPPPPYSKESTEQRPNPRHSLTEIDDMLNVAGNVVRNRERELDAAALASRSLLEENRLMFAKREALLARLPINPRASPPPSTTPIERQHPNRSSSWSTCSDDSDPDNSTATATPFRDMTVPLPADLLEAHRVVTPTHSVCSSLDINGGAPSSPLQPPAARLVPTQAERIAALHAGLATPPPSHPPRPKSAASRRVSVSPAAVSHLQDANAALLARVQELEEATAKAQTEGATRMRRLQAEAESLRAQLGEAEKANEGLRSEAEEAKAKQRVRAQSAGARQHWRESSIEESEDSVRDFAPSATWRPEFRSLRGGSPRPAVPARAATTMSTTVSRGSRLGTGPVRAQTSIGAPTATSTPVRRAGRAQSNTSPPPVRNTPISPLRHAPARPSGLRHQRANSFTGLGKSFQTALEDARRVVPTIEEGVTDAENGGASPKAGFSPNPLFEVKANPTRLGAGVVAFPSVSDEEMRIAREEGLNMSPSATQGLAQELVAKISELRATNEEILSQRENLKEMLGAVQAEADELKRVCERLEHEVEVERSASGGGSDGEARVPRPERPGLQLEIPPFGLDGSEPSWTGSVRGRKKSGNGGGALLDLAAELGAELQGLSVVPSAMHMTVGLTWHRTDNENAPPADLASELMNASMAGSKPSTPTATTFGLASRSRRPSISIKTPGPTKRALGGRGLATRAKNNPRRVRKSLSSVMFGGKALPSPGPSPTAADSPSTPTRNKEEAEEEFVTPRSEFVTPLVTPLNPTNRQQEVYLTPTSILRVPGGLTTSLMTDDEDAIQAGPSKSKDDSTMAQLRAGLAPLFKGVVQGQGALVPPSQPSPAVRRKQSQMRLLLSKDEPLEPWEAKIRELYSDIKAFEQEDPGMSSAGEDSRRFSRRARALGRMSLRRRVTGAQDYTSDYAADDSEVGERVMKRREEEQKRVAGFELAKKLHQKSMSTFLEVLLLVQFAVVLIVFVYTAVRRGPKAVLGNKRVR